MKTKFVEFGGERYEVPAGSNPRSIAVAQRMQKALRAAEKPSEAPSRSSGGGGSRKANTASKTPSSASQRASYSASGGNNSQQVPGDPRSSGGRGPSSSRGGPARYRQRRDSIGASNQQGMNENTKRVEVKDERPLVSGRSSTGGRPRYDDNARMREDASKATNLQLAVRAGKFHGKDEKTDRNAIADAEIYRRARATAEDKAADIRRKARRGR